jgi:hypothetical protein
MIRKMGLICLATLLVAVNASLWAYSPDQMLDEFRAKYDAKAIEASLANFGNPPYGTTLVGRVFYTPNTDADNEEDRHLCLACSRLAPISFENDPDMINSPIVMVDRGKCSFV